MLIDGQPSAEDDGADPHTVVTFTYPEEMSRWQPLYKWLLAIPHFFVLLGLAVAGVVIIAGYFTVLITGDYPVRRGISLSLSTVTASAPRPT